MQVVFALFAIFAAASAQRYAGYAPYGYGGYGHGAEDWVNTIPNPYSFNYVAPGHEGQSSHQETGDGVGNVQGSYSLTDIDGNVRVVEYVADAGGFRANVRTNEPGTANSNPADVHIESAADPGLSNFDLTGYGGGYGGHGGYGGGYGGHGGYGGGWGGYRG